MTISQTIKNKIREALGSLKPKFKPAILALACLVLVVVPACSFLNTNNTAINNDGGTGSGSNPTGPADNPGCKDVVSSISLDLASGTTGNDEATVGTPVSLDVALLGVDGKTESVPNSCRSVAPQAQASGNCSLAPNPTLDAIVATGTSPGACLVTATAYGHSDSQSFTVTK